MQEYKYKEVDKMYQLLKVGTYANIPVCEYYVESEEEVKEIKNAPLGSTVLILTKDGLKVKMLHSSGWIDI